MFCAALWHSDRRPLCKVCSDLKLILALRFTVNGLSLTSAGDVLFRCPFDPVTAAQVRRIRPRGSWQQREGGWLFPFEAALLLEQQFGEHFPIQAPLSQWLDSVRHPLPPLPPHRALVEAAGLQDPLPDGRSLFAHQRAAVRWLLARRGALLADEMGLGKTLTALTAARALLRLNDCRLLVVAPVGLHDHWRREALSLELAPTLVSWARLPSEPPPGGVLLLVDEAHFAQNLQAARSKALLRLARHPRIRAVWLLTGTPLKNGRPIQLLPLLMAIGHPLARDRRAYETLFCNGHWRQLGGRQLWDCQGASRLEELERLLRPQLLHRRKQDCLDLPPKQRRFQPIQLSAQQQRQFDQAMERRLHDYRRRAALGVVRSDAETLALLTALRRLAALQKLPAAAELLERLRSSGEAVVLFSSFVFPLLQLQRSLGGELLCGRVELAERQRRLERFQQGRSKLLLATYGVAGLGLGLQRASQVVLLERPWTPGDAEQAEDRCHRIGSRRSVTSHWLQLGSADALVDGLILSKADRIEVVLGQRRRLLRRQPLTRMLNDLLQP